MYYRDTELPAGPWHDEPDRVEFEAHGFPCILNRGPIGCRVHGGLSYAHECQGVICHAPKEPDDVWWLGFDCAHYLDLSPAMFTFSSSYPGETYRTISYVRSETESLAAQAQAVAL